MIFSAIDRLGNHVPEASTGLLAAKLTTPRRVLSAFGFESLGDELDVSSIRLPVSTIQVYAESPAPWKEEELESLRELFFAVREEIVVTANRQE